MGNLEINDSEVLQNLALTAQEEIADAVAKLPEDGSPEALEFCRVHVENIGVAAEMSGFDGLKLIADHFYTELGANNSSLSPDLGMDLVGWFGDVLLHIESPNDADLVEILLTPLLPEAQLELRKRLKAPGVPGSVAPDFDGAQFDAGESEDPVEKDSFSGFPEELDMNSMDMSVFDEDEVDVEGGFDTDSMLGILASELHDISPQVVDLALTISNTDNTDDLGRALEAYLELISRVHEASEGLGLHGLVQICQFIEDNLALIAEIPKVQRNNTLKVLQGWPTVVISHLVEPKDDALCLAVVDFLELENWPEPLPYRSMRGLIEGLTKELEMTGDYEVEARETLASAEDVELVLSEDASAELIDAFFAESPRHAEAFSSLVEAIASGNDIGNNVEAAQRIAHTLKGSGNLVGVKGIANLAHHLEDIFDHIAKSHVTPPDALAHTMQEAADTIEVMLEYLQDTAPPPDNAQRVLQDVLDWANRLDSGDIADDGVSVANIEVEPFVVEEPLSESIEPGQDEIADQIEPVELPKKPALQRQGEVIQRAEAIRVPVDILDDIFRVVGETAISIGQIQERITRLDGVNKMVRKNDVTLQQRRYELENLVNVRGMAARHRTAVASDGSNFDPLELDEYGELYSVAHAYIEGVADSREILRSINDELSELNGQFQLQKRLNKELQQVVMTTRLVPVNSISARLHRAVRQASRSTNKHAELTIAGDDLLLDGDVLSKLADPLMHMLRNAIDHGIETDDMRFDKGKAETGQINLQFLQEGKNVVVNCIDDGGGLDYERIRQIAIKRGLMSEQEGYDNATLARMILQSGFSTSRQVTQVSGRGVGMDVVHNTILSLGGTVSIGDAENGGTQISLRLPITLLTSHCLLVGVGQGIVYAIPTSNLIQILSPGTGKFSDVGGSSTYQLGQDVYPVKSLNSMLGRSDSENFNTENSTVLLVQSAEGIVAVTLESVISSYDLVVKNMGAFVKNIRGVSGVSTLGDGSVVAVLDLPLLLQAGAVSSDNKSTPDLLPGAAVPDPQISLPRVLIVDDSLSVRNSLKQLMRDGGYHAATARDGLEAVDLLEKEQPDIVLADLEMPRMNGLELANYIRKSEQWRDLPIVMITSRTAAKHRQQAEAVGINRYITKPFTEDDVLASIDEILAATAG